MKQARGFLLGKFMPFHEGHALLCDVASGLVEELTVLVCSRDCEPIDGHLRFSWVRESVKSNVRVLHLHRDIPQKPSEHPDFWSIWKKVIAEFHPEAIDTVFGSEDYIHQLAKELDAKPFILDIPRNIVPVSATNIRQAPFSNWQYIPNVVRPYFQKRVCILGPESTGKSQLNEYLAKHYTTAWVPEYGRTYDELYKQGENWEDKDFLAIADGHRNIQLQITKRSAYIYFEDTDLLQTIVWAKYLLGYIPKNLDAKLQDWSRADFYLLLKPNVAWHDDGTRYAEDNKVRYWFFNTLLELLTTLDIPFEVIEDAQWHARETSAVKHIDNFINMNKTQ